MNNPAGSAGGFHVPAQPNPPSAAYAPPPSATLPVSAPGSAAYPELAEYMGLELTPEEIALNMPEYSQNNQVGVQPKQPGWSTLIVQPNRQARSMFNRLYVHIQYMSITESTDNIGVVSY